MGLRRTLDDEHVQKKILSELRLQPFIKPACYAAGIHPQRFFEWYAKWKADDPKADIYHDFFEKFEMTRGQWECNAVSDIASKPKGTRGLMWVLSRYKAKVYGSQYQLSALEGFPLPPKALDRMSDGEVEAYILLLSEYLSGAVAKRTASGQVNLTVNDEEGPGRILPAPGAGAPEGDAEEA